MSTAPKTAASGANAHRKAPGDHATRPSADDVSSKASETADADTTERFSQARRARSTALLEDYTELIADLLAEHGEARVTEIAARIGVAHPTAAKAIARLKREGLAQSRPYRGVFLTEEGAAMAERVRARHRLVVDFLVSVGVPPEAAEIDAEGIEHHVSDTTLSVFRRFLETGRA